MHIQYPLEIAHFGGSKTVSLEGNELLQELSIENGDFIYKRNTIAY